MSATPTLRRFVLISCILAAACSAAKEPASEEAADHASTSSAPTVTPTGKVIDILMITDETSSRFEPSEIEVHRGDVLRYTIGVGVHNVNFLPDSNAGIPDLPPPSEMLQLPGQTVDVLVAFPSGSTVYFQCDPHAALGMRGHLRVRD